jgi:hypothetical protein
MIRLLLAERKAPPNFFSTRGEMPLDARRRAR